MVLLSQRSAGGIILIRVSNGNPTGNTAIPEEQRRGIWKADKNKVTGPLFTLLIPGARS
jgi:hypothetical protein